MSDEDVLAALEEQLGDIAEPDVRPVTEMTEHQLRRRLEDVRRELHRRGEMFSSSAQLTEQGRALHSERAALLIEIRRRR